ncbi:MAG: hypothetical protein AAGA43_12125 [Bacteroidota bacterium]
MASQYLAAAGISFLKPEKDDSHTSLKFNTADRSLYTHPLNENGDTLSFDYRQFLLRWNSPENESFISLNWCSHKKIVQWIKEQSRTAGIAKDYMYKFHYHLPYAILGDFIFEVTDKDSLTKLSDLRVLGQQSLESFVSHNNLTSEVRVWPHHFDSGAYIPDIGGDGDLALGLGLAIPDELHSDFYFYMALYDRHGSVPTDNLPALSNGIWSNTGFKGAVLPVRNASNRTMVSQFLIEAFTAYKQTKKFKT